MSTLRRSLPRRNHASATFIASRLQFPNSRLRLKPVAIPGPSIVERAHFPSPSKALQIHIRSVLSQAYNTRFFLWKQITYHTQRIGLRPFPFDATVVFFCFVRKGPNNPPDGAFNYLLNPGLIRTFLHRSTTHYTKPDYYIESHWHCNLSRPKRYVDLIRSYNQSKWISLNTCMFVSLTSSPDSTSEGIFFSFFLSSLKKKIEKKKEGMAGCAKT